FAAAYAAEQSGAPITVIRAELERYLAAGSAERRITVLNGLLAGGVGDQLLDQLAEPFVGRSASGRGPQYKSDGFHAVRRQAAFYNSLTSRIEPAERGRTSHPVRSVSPEPDRAGASSTPYQASPPL